MSRCFDAWLDDADAERFELPLVPPDVSFNIERALPRALVAELDPRARERLMLRKRWGRATAKLPPKLRALMHEGGE